jgi:hypothetical protein
MTGIELLDEGNYNEAVVQLLIEYEQQPDEGSLLTLAISQLCVRDAEASLRSTNELIRLQEGVHEDVYIYAGVACWMMTHYEEGVDYWLQGESCTYRDMSGGIGIALLQHFAGVRLNDVSLIDASNKLIRNRLQKPWAIHWPGPLGKFVVGDLSEVEIHIEATRVELHEILLREQLCQLEFHRGVKALGSGNKSLYRKHLKKCRLPHETKFSAEAFLARCELIK